MTEKLTAEQIVERAERFKSGKRDPGFEDNKAWCDLQEIITLLETGASVINLNSRDIGGNYIHEVNYKRYTFISVTKQPVEELRQY